MKIAIFDPPEADRYLFGVFTPSFAGVY